MTHTVAERHTATGDQFRERLTAVFADAKAPFCATGAGSLLAIHPLRGPVTSPGDLARAEPRPALAHLTSEPSAGNYPAPPLPASRRA